MTEYKEQREAARGHLIAFALRELAEWCAPNAEALPTGLSETPDEWLAAYRELLGEPKPREPGAPLLSIFSRVKLAEGDEPPKAYWPAGPLSLDDLVYPVKEAGTKPHPELWDGFLAEWEQLATFEGDARFEACTHLLHRWAWAVPCSHGEPGVSLYDEFRALSALVHASGCEQTPAKEFLLVGGDIPGIQDFVYTITSKGAAKGLRGRSFFVQLLGDAVVRRLLADLDLPESNVVYSAGGNFVLLAPGGTEAKETVERVMVQVNTRLVEAIQGDTALVLSAKRVKAVHLFKPEPFRKRREKLGKRIARAKAQALRELTGDWATLFEPQGKGSHRSCAVCRIEVDERNSKLLDPTGEIEEDEQKGIEPPRICYLCDSFGELARAIRYEDLWMEVRAAPEKLGKPVEPRDGWTQLLERMTGFHYGFSERRPQAPVCMLAINQPGFLTAGACGFRMLANVTPTNTAEDVTYLRETLKADGEKVPQKGEIRSFALLAQAAASVGAIERVGVLRMDVDSLGWVFSQGLPDLTLSKLSALSGMMDLFFGGYLNTLVRGQAGNDLYIIYAGGDDLFVVGAWYHLPDLAETIRNRFKAFTGENPALSLSGGITLEGAKFPLYRAAERAGEAEGKAKGHERPDNRTKDALCFLDTVVGWEHWNLVRSQKDELLWLIGARDNSEDEQRLPRGLLHTVQSIHQLYLSGLKAWRRRMRASEQQHPHGKRKLEEGPPLFYGRWLWMQVYAMSRLADRSKKRVPEAPAKIEQLQQEIMQPATVQYSGLAARWAEYSTRPAGQVKE